MSLSVNAFRTLRRALDPLVPVGAPSFGFFRDSRGATLKLYFHQDAALRLVFVPSKFRVYGARCDFPQGSPCAEWRLWDLQDRFRSFCAREGLPLLDLTGPLRDAAAGGRVLYAPEESHWNAQGHRFVAELLAASLPAR